MTPGDRDWPQVTQQVQDSTRTRLWEVGLSLFLHWRGQGCLLHGGGKRTSRNGYGWAGLGPQSSTDNVPAPATLSIPGSRGLAEGLPPTPARRARRQWVFLNGCPPLSAFLPAHSKNTVNSAASPPTPSTSAQPGWVLDPWLSSVSPPAGRPPLAGHHLPHSQPWVQGDIQGLFSYTLGIL